MISIYAGTKVGVATSAAMVAVGSLDGGNVSVTAAVGCCIFVGGLTWHLSKGLQKIHDTQKSNAQTQRDNQRINTSRLRRIEKHLGISQAEIISDEDIREDE